MPITPFAPGGVFRPEAVRALAALLRAICQELGLNEQSEAGQTVAATIIQFASTGDYDERGLHAAVLKALKQSR